MEKDFFVRWESSKDLHSIFDALEKLGVELPDISSLDVDMINLGYNGEDTVIHFEKRSVAFLSDSYCIKNNLYVGHMVYRLSDLLEMVKRKRQISFSKSDIKPGMILESRSGKRFLVLKNSKNEMILPGQGSYLKFENIENNLKNPISDGFDICAVYETKNGNKATISDIFADRNLKLIWKRPNKIIYSKSEIAKKLGLNMEDFDIE